MKRMGFSLPLSEVVGSNPASASLGFLGGLLLSEEFPEGWWGSWVSQRATESLPTVIHSKLTDWCSRRNFRQSYEKAHPISTRCHWNANKSRRMCRVC